MSESFTQLARAKKPEKPEKSQLELRAILEQKLVSLKPILDEGIKEYEQALKDDIFEDQPGEEAGSGEKRKEVMQKKLTTLIDRAEKLKAKLDSGEEILQATPEVSITYQRPNGKTETITLDFEAKLAEFLTFYQKTNIDLPPDFEDTAREIWDRNQIIAGDALKLFEANPDEHMSLVDFIVMESKIFAESGIHLSDYTKKSGQWLNTKSSARLVYSNWDPGNHQLLVNVVDLTNQGGTLGVRPARCFF